MQLIETVQFKFKTTTGESKKLHYQLFDTPITRRWVEIIKQNIEKEHTPRGVLTNYIPEDLPVVQKKMADILEFINSKYDRKLNTYPELDIYTFEVLNYLHYEFELFGDRNQELKDSGKWDSELHRQFLLLNETIHMYEDVLKNISDAEMGLNPYMACTWNYKQKDFKGEVTDEDTSFFTTNFLWGHLYLGYNTLGKDWLAVQQDNDIEVIERKEVRPQHRFAAESWLYFGNDDDWAGGMGKQMQFSEWYDKLDPDIQSQIPRHDQHKLRLGRALLGKVFINETFKGMERDWRAWTTPNSELRNKWNREVFHSLTELEEVKILYPKPKKETTDV